jgi:DNA polymerase elongation subunit (family B)
MYIQDELQSMAFFDVETAPEFENLDALAEEKPAMAKLWSKRCEYLRDKFEENRDKTDEELYINKAALHPEFNRIVCASFGRLEFLGPDPTIVIKSYYGTDEKEILEGVEKVFNKMKKFKFVGHNIKRFDVPVLCKRFIINGMKLPSLLQVQNIKPWEMPFLDTSELWSFGAWQEGFTSLELLMTCLGLESPKDDIRGEDVGRVYYEDSDVERIAVYCEKDVYSLAQALLRMSGLNLLDGYECQIGK